MKPPFTYFGGKTAIAGRIAALLPPHEHYVEPFAGSLAVLLAKPPSQMETVNDIDGDLMTFWRVLRDDPEGLERACALTPHSRAEHQSALDPGLELASDLEQARRVWVKLTQGRGGQLRQRTGWRFHRVPAGGTAMPGYLSGYVARILPAAARLASVSLECLPALEVITAYGAFPSVLIYADPPYLDSVRTHGGFGDMYNTEMRTTETHVALAQALRKAKAAVVLSGYHSPLYDDLYAGWHQVEVRAQAGNGHIRWRTEVLWSNRPFCAVQGVLEEAAAMPP